MRGIHLWRAVGQVAPCSLAPALTQLLDRVASAAATEQAACAVAAAAHTLTVPSDGGSIALATVAGATAATHSVAKVAASRAFSLGGQNSGACCRPVTPASLIDATAAVATGYSAQPAAASRSVSGSRTGGYSGGGAGGGRSHQGRHRHWSSWGAGAGAGPGVAGARSSSAFVFGASAAAAAAAALGLSVSAFASALADSPEQSLDEAVTAARAALKSVWGEVEEEFARVNARLPAHAPSLKGEPPTVSEVYGSVEVLVPLREDADPNAVLRELRHGLAGRGSTTSYVESVHGGSRTVQMEVRQAGGTLQAMMFVPPRGGEEVQSPGFSPDSRRRVVVSKRGAFSPEELAALGRVVRAANVTFGLEPPARSASGRRHGELDSETSARAMDAALEEFGRVAMAGFVAGPLAQLFTELQRGLGVPLPGELEDEEDDGEGGPGAGFGAPGGLGGGGFPGLPALPSGPHPPRPKGGSSAQGHDWGSPAAARAVGQLLAMGAQVFPPGKKDKMDWGVLAGYEEQKRTLEDCLLLPLLRPDVYARLARATRKTFASNRPRAVLFEGPPGTGKTTSARVISSQAAVPLIYLPLETVLSKWYGQSEQQLGAVFKAAEAMGGAIIFLDELDALGGNREGGGLHEVSRRLLSVLLREMEGFDADTKRTVVIGATNRTTDLDPALLSRFDLVITFGLPDEACRQLILRQYAQQLSESELGRLAEQTAGMSGRDLRDVCEHTERRWASKIIRGEVREEDLPPLAEYLASANERATAVQHVQQQASAAGALNRLLGAAGGGRGLPTWLGGGQH